MTLDLSAITVSSPSISFQTQCCRIPFPIAMTIQSSFTHWSSNNGRSVTSPLSLLKGATIGIDGAHYLEKIHSQNITEPLVNALGGQPFGFQEGLTHDLEAFKKADIKPVFVFSGCSVVRTEKPFSTPDDSAKGRVKAWEIYDQGQGNKAVEQFTAVGIGPVQDRFRMMMKLLRENDVDFQVAPYASWPQLAYLEKNDYIDAIVGPTELFLWEVERIITDIDLHNGKFTHVQKQRLQSETHLTPEQFIDAILLSGSKLCKPFPPLESANPSGAFLEAVNMLKRFRTAGNVISARDHQQVYVDRFRKARAAIKHHVIMKDDGTVEQLDLPESPSDVHEFIGQRLPDELYFYLSRGIIGPQVLEMLTTGELIIPAPLDCSESETYKKFLTGLDTLRTEALAMVTKPLVRYWSARDIKVYSWHDPQRPRTISAKEVTPPSDKAQNWNVKDPVFGPEMDKQTKQWGEFAFCVTSLDDEAYAAKTITPKNPTNLLIKQDEIRINALYRMLQLRGFIDGDTHKLTPWGRALSKAIRVQDTEFEPAIIPLYIALELYRMKVLKSDNFFPNCSGHPSHGTEQERKYVTLISRVASLFNIAHKPVGYTGPLSRELLAFTGFSRALTKELRNYLEMVVANLLTAGDADRENRKDWGGLGLMLPFINDSGAALGVAVKTYLDELCKESEPTSKPARDRVMKQVEGMFQECEDVAIDIEIAFGSFDALVASVKSLADDGIMTEEAKEFVAAAKWLGSRRTVITRLWSDDE